MNEKKWVTHSPVFECDKFNPEMMVYSPWSGHRLFAYDLVVEEEPECIVELGSFYGCSSFAFLQAIKDYRLNSEFYAIDTWAGDSFTENDYRENIFGQYKEIQDTCFQNQKTHILIMTFDEALNSFEDHSIDILHIDGSHTYEDVKHDFFSWVSKVKVSGIVLFHDVGKDLLDGKPLGSHLFWEELKEDNPYTFEFPFSFGLGVLLFEKNKYHALLSMIDFQYYQEQSNFADVMFKDTVRKQYFELKSFRKFVESLQQQVAICQDHLKRYAKDISAKDEYISELQQKNEQSVCLNSELKSEIAGLYAQQRKIVADYESTLKGKEQYISELRDGIDKFNESINAKNAYIIELKKSISDYRDDGKAKETYISALETKVENLTDIVRKQMADIDRINLEHDEGIRRYQENVDAKECYIGELKTAIGKYEKTIIGKDQYIEELKGTIAKYDKTVSGKDQYIEELKDTIAKYDKTVSGKDQYIEELKDTVAKYDKTVSGKDQYIEELKGTIEDYKKTFWGKLTCKHEVENFH